MFRSTLSEFVTWIVSVAAQYGFSSVYGHHPISSPIWAPFLLTSHSFPSPPTLIRIKFQTCLWCVPCQVPNHMAATNAALFSVNIVCLWLQPLSQWREMHWKPKLLLFSYLWPLFDRGCHVEYVHVANECCKVAKQFSLERICTSMYPVDFARALSWMGGRESKILGSSEAHNLHHVYPSCVQQ